MKRLTLVRHGHAKFKGAELKDFERPLSRRVVIIAVQHHFRAQIEHRLNLNVRCRLRHNDNCPNRAVARRERYALRMVTGGGADDAALRDGLR